MYNNLVFSIDFGLVVFFAYADAIVELFYHAVCFVVEVVYVCVLDWDSGGVFVCYAVDNGIQVAGLGVGGLDVWLLLLRHQ